jgi:hypothetical protein
MALIHRLDGALDLAGLAARLAMTGRSARLALILFELKDILLVTRVSASSRNRLANPKIVAIIRARWVANLTGVHQEMAERLFDAVARTPSGEGLADENICGVVVHSELAGTAHELPPANSVLANLIQKRATRAYEEGMSRDAVALTSACIAPAARHLMRERMLKAEWLLPMHLRHRAIAAMTLGKIHRAYRDADDALRLFLDLRGRLSIENQVLIDRKIAETFGVRGDALSESGAWRARRLWRYAYVARAQPMACCNAMIWRSPILSARSVGLAKRQTANAGNLRAR